MSLGFFVEHLFCSAFKTLNKAQGGMGQAKPNPSLSATSLVSRMFEIVAEFSKFQKPVSTGKKTPAKTVPERFLGKHSSIQNPTLWVEGWLGPFKNSAG